MSQRDNATAVDGDDAASPALATNDASPLAVALADSVDDDDDADAVDAVAFVGDDVTD